MLKILNYSTNIIKISKNNNKVKGDIKYIQDNCF